MLSFEFQSRDVKNVLKATCAFKRTWTYFHRLLLFGNRSPDVILA